MMKTHARRLMTERFSTGLCSRYVLCLVLGYGDEFSGWEDIFYIDYLLTV